MGRFTMDNSLLYFYCYIILVISLYLLFFIVDRISSVETPPGREISSVRECVSNTHVSMRRFICNICVLVRVSLTVYVCLVFMCVCSFYVYILYPCSYSVYAYGWSLCDGRHWWGWMAAWRASSSRLVFDQSVYVMLSTVFRRRHFEHICRAQQSFMSILIRDNLKRKRGTRSNKVSSLSRFAPLSFVVHRDYRALLSIVSVTFARNVPGGWWSSRGRCSSCTFPAGASVCGWNWSCIRT